jgi:uncharacterized protein involved in outer membrane biogenesis
MARQRRWLWRLIFFVVFILAVLSLAPLVPLGWLKPKVEARLSAALGRTVTVDSMHLTVWGGPYLTINGLTAKEDPDFGNTDFLKANDVRVDFLLRQLFSRQFVVKRLTLHAPEFAFIKKPTGAWSWSSLGEVSSNRAAQRPDGLALVQTFAAVLVGESAAKIDQIDMDGVAVRLIDQTGVQPPETVYKNITLNVMMSDDTENATSRHATGTLRAASDESGAELLKAEMPFDFIVNRNANPGLSIKGAFGPGPLQTKTFIAQSFRLAGEFNNERASGLSGNGGMSATGVFLPSVNVSQQVASAARVPTIGDMSEGTKIASLETGFHLERDVVNTTNLHVQQLDGLGDASAEAGWFKIEAALTLNYSASVQLSSEATAQLKSSANVLISAAVGALTTNNRVTVPLSITGDVRNPRVQVDMRRALGF